MSSIVQYVIIRSDLLKAMEWPIGAVIAQACHACTATIHQFYNDEHTQNYLKDLDNMHKVVLDVSFLFKHATIKRLLIRQFVSQKNYFF